MMPVNLDGSADFCIPPPTSRISFLIDWRNESKRSSRACMSPASPYPCVNVIHRESDSSAQERTSIAPSRSNLAPVAETEVVDNTLLSW